MGRSWVNIRRADAEDAEALTRIALAAKRQWGYRDDWIELWTPALTITPELIGSMEFWLASEDEKAIGFCALRVTGGKATLEHLWVQPGHLGSGVGRQLFAQAVARARASGCGTLEVESDPNARGFYERMGARQVRESRTEVGGAERFLPVLELRL